MRIATFVTSATLALMSAVTFAQNVSYDVEKQRDFSKYRTYAWVEGTNLLDPLNHRRILNAIDAQLASKGLTRLETSAAADALIAYHVNLDTNRRTHQSGPDTLIGSLLVDVVDRKSKKSIWRARVTNEIDSYASAEAREKNINLMAEKMFSNFPPNR